MRFQRDWLRRVLTVPYIPTLGPVHPDTFTPALFEEAVAASAAGRVLPFDKDSRWSDRKHDTVLADEVVHQPECTIIPVLSRRGTGAIKTYYYGTQAPDHAALRAATRRWCIAYGAAAGRVIWFDAAAPAAEATASTRVLLKVFGTSSQSSQPEPGLVHTLDDCPAVVRATFTEFAQQLADTGFGFLHRHWQAGQLDGPILTTVERNRVVGAIGPLRTLPDPHGTPVLLPQYFGVLPGHRGHGHGRALWRAATAWGEHHRAAYQVLQTETGQVSDQLFLSEGLLSLGFACAVTA